MANINGPIRLTGFSGALDTDSLIKDLMKAERMPLDKLLKQKQYTLWKREDYRSMNTSLLSFRNAVNDLRFESNFETVKASSSNTGVLDILSGGSNPSTSTVSVSKLASSASIIGNKVTQSSSAPVTTGGTVKITGASGSAEITITAGTSTLDSIVKDINNNSKATGVKASFDQSAGVLYLSSTTTGSSSKVEITPGGATNALAQVFNLDTAQLSKTGEDAEYTVNGSNVIKSSTNNVSINGVQVTLRGSGDATISAATDRSGITDKIKSFVEKYNEIVDLFSTTATTRKNREYEPLTSEEKGSLSEKEIELWEKKARAGTLYNDTLLTGTLSALRSALNLPLDTPSEDQLALLSQIGITVKSDYRENGKLEIDEAKLQDAINNRFDEVKQLFTQTSDTPADTPENIKKRRQELGFADRLYEEITAQLNKFTKKIGTGSIESIDDSVLGRELKQLGQKESDLERKLADIETRYYKKFAAMEQAIQKLNTQSSWLFSQLGG
ncbi:flagellar hook protein [Paenibacillus sp. LC231]|uniref:flagellar filament capping protein FliD n=1 Tax=unclassified Paenibacillus TaxID=185978 RepID=UPI0008DDB9AC|nr:MULTISPECIES: flagellar filament capping protein FliD [unclassified Paenibacillus]MCT1403768.1 flagellar filament capping protein FliD [Paenibacillus sp. p3-SID867]OIB03134.1 flagellar hook protein [Paenibacillus sp. LC231]